MLLALVGISIGIGLAMQTAVNSQLRKFVESPFTASMISFIIGTAFLTLAMVFSSTPISIPLETVAELPVWIWFGGIFGVIGLTTSILLFPKIGSIQASVMPILGMIMMGMLIDNFGWFSSMEQRFTSNRLIGVILLLIGIFLTVALTEIISKRHNVTKQVIAKERSDGQWKWRMLGVGAGMLMAAQAAVNGQLGSVLGSPIHAAFVSFSTGAAILILIVGVRYRSYANIKIPVEQKAPWWIWSGGLLGGLYVLLNVYLVGQIGTGQTVILALFGQLSGSLLVERFGLLGSNRGQITTVHILGLAVMLAGIIFIQLL
ncbi:DMT family transporter [Planococcus sp. CAU13]|uniref:DMT family transporter n=1 Tax=Planococcus sp. CAU13 TaxID=1541197 RepID=UPI00052FF61B|nr:DMT family transporter [Planococcus sp. CAU13]